MSQTYAQLPIAEMDAMLRRLGEQEKLIRKEAFDVGSEALVSEAQIESPVLTGFMKSTHVVFKSSDEEAIIGVNAGYALAVHETHPTNKRWFVNAIQMNFNRVFEGALKLALARAARRAGR